MVARSPGGKQVLVFALVAGLSLLIRLAIGFGSYSGTVPLMSTAQIHCN